MRYADKRVGGLGMRIGRRLISAAVTVALALLLCFALAQWTPGDAFTQLELDPAIPAATIRHLRHQYLPQAGLTQRFGAWAGAALRGDLGYSIEYHRPVSELLRERAPASLELMALGLGLAWGAGLLLALTPAWLGERGWRRWARRLSGGLHAIAALVAALPLGVLALGALIAAPAAWLPGAGGGSPWLPASVLGLAFLPTVTMQSAHALDVVLRHGFIQQGRAAGKSPARLLLRHALPNAADVLVPIASLTISQALIELVVIEPMLGWPGLGQLSLEAARNHDMPVLAGLVLITTLVVIAANLGSEMTQAALNPRMRRGLEFKAREAAA